MEAAANRSERGAVAKAEFDIKDQPASDRKTELRRRLLAQLLVDARRDAQRYVESYDVGRGAE